MQYVSGDKTKRKPFIATELQALRAKSQWLIFDNDGKPDYIWGDESKAREHLSD